MDITALRQEIDDIDTAMHDLLMRRVALAEQIGRLKQAPAEAARQIAAMRPAREAQILRRLLTRHKGSLPPVTILHLWREIFSAILRLQGDLAIACYFPVQDTALRRAFRDLARDHFGHSTPFDLHETTGQVITATMQDDAVVGILPLPEPEDPEPWWTQLRFSDVTGPRIIARLPFARGLPGAQALAVGRFNFEPSGYDHSFIAVQLTGDMSGGRLQGILSDAGFQVLSLYRWRDPITRDYWGMAEVSGFVETADLRLARLISMPSPAVRHATSLGGYAVPPDIETVG